MKNFILFLFIFMAVVAEGQTVIRDNSFLIEEAYNQEKGVVQHIFTSQFNNRFNKTEGAFSQEWPVGSEKHQFSYTLPFGYENQFILHDLEINYRYQLVSGSKLFIAPGLSLILPTGNTRLPGEDGTAGYQISLPLSFEINPTFALHANLGTSSGWQAATSTMHSVKSETTSYGASLIYYLASNVNLMLETLHSFSVNEKRAEVPEVIRSTIVNPGVRFAFNFSSGMQIVPGFSTPYDILSKENFYFLYLSVEHPFKKTKS
jgi:hypothetical protein